MSREIQFDASVVIVSYNTREVLRKCLLKLQESIGRRAVEVIVVDNASRDGSADMVEKCFPAYRLVRSAVNLGFAAANNVGFGLTRGRYLILLNPDALLQPIALEHALGHMDKKPEVGLAGGLLINGQGISQPSARCFPSLLNEFLVISGLATRMPNSRLFGRFDRTWADPSQAAEVDWVPGAFSIIRRETLEEVGQFDERFFLYYEEVDLCRRIKAAGWKVWYWPDIVVPHLGGESSKTVEGVEFSQSGSQLVLWRMRSALLYYRKHHGRFSAWMVSRLEMAWQYLRHVRASAGPSHPARLAKGAEALRVAHLMRRAWTETRGGALSPPRPW